MKVGFLGNMNNNHFAMARYLRDRGVDADVMLFDHEAEHFHPSADTYDDSYRTFCRPLTWGNPARWGHVSDGTIRRDTENYEVLIGCGLAPAFCSRIGRPLDVFAPYGADLYHYTRYRLTYPSRIVNTWRAIRAQRRAIPRASVFHMDMTNPVYEGRWTELKGDSERWYLSMPLVHIGTYTPERVAAESAGHPWAARFARIRAEHDLVLYSHTRHVWNRPLHDPGHKGNDRLLRGVALFKRAMPGVRVALITFEYGTSVQQSKALARHLDIEDTVHWFPIARRKDLMGGILLADIVCSEFVHSWLTGGVIFEALAMSRPLLGYRDDALYQPRSGDLYPMLNASTAEDISARLQEYMADPSRHRAAAAMGRQWYAERVVTPVVDRYVDYVATKGGSVPAHA